jgi:pSer/pThr/pTyr-binding forkhead associated (FHA) protein
VSSVGFAIGMSMQAPVRPAVAEGRTERFDPIACLDERVRRQATPAMPAEPGRYIEVQGPGETLLIPLDRGVMHIGRGLAADLRLDENSVSRRHAILVHRPSGARILDDRSSNGTFVNGRRIVQADLENGDVLMLGRVVLRYLTV